MPSLLWLALALVVLWFLVKFAFKVASGIVHVLLLLALIVLVLAFVF